LDSLINYADQIATALTWSQEQGIAKLVDQHLIKAHQSGPKQGRCNAPEAAVKMLECSELLDLQEENLN